MKFRTQHNYKDAPVKGQTKFGLSQTIPDQSLSIRQLHERYVRGQPLSEYERQPLYAEDNELSQLDGVDFQSLDLTEIEEINKTAAQTLFKVKKDEADRKAKEYHDKQRKKFYAEFEQQQQKKD